MELNQRGLTMANALVGVLKGSKLDNAEVLEVLGYLQRYYSMPERPRLNPAELPDFSNGYRFDVVYLDGLVCVDGPVVMFPSSVEGRLFITFVSSEGPPTCHTLESVQDFRKVFEAGIEVMFPHTTSVKYESGWDHVRPMRTYKSLVPERINAKCFSVKQRVG